MLRGFLPFNPLIEIGTLEAPLPAHLERGDLAALRHRVNGLSSDLEQLGHLR